ETGGRRGAVAGAGGEGGRAAARGGEEREGGGPGSQRGRRGGGGQEGPPLVGLCGHEHGRDEHRDRNRHGRDRTGNRGGGEPGRGPFQPGRARRADGARDRPGGRPATGTGGLGAPAPRAGPRRARSRPGPGPAAGPEPAGGPEAGGPDATPRPAPRPAHVNPRPILQGVGIGLLLLAVVALGMAVYLYFLSDVQEARAQTIMYTRLQYELGNQTAPLGPTAPATPVAVLNIPAIGIRDMVVVQGTSAENMTLGPGHLRSTVMPGQAGVSEIFGRRATFGAPFARLGELRPGNLIVTITGQGRSVYRVAALGSSRTRIVDPAPNRLILVTAASQYIPAYYIEVDARLVSAPRPAPAAAHVLNAPELTLAVN